MKQWTEIYNKYKDTELMKEFVAPFQCASEWDSVKHKSIKFIWGYLIVFAETKGISLEGDGEPHSFTSLEKWMLWCADKFFEEKK